jgi:ribosomal protein L7/L12
MIKTYKTRCDNSVVYIITKDSTQSRDDVILITSEQFEQIKSIVRIFRNTIQHFSPYHFDATRSTVINPTYSEKVNIIRLVRTFFTFDLRTAKVLVELAQECVQDEIDAEEMKAKLFPNI